MTAAEQEAPRYRWVVLAVGAGATAALAAVQGGLPALGPAIQETFGLTLVEVTAVFTSFAVGTVATLLAWGVLADRVGERFVIAGGVGAASLLMAGVAASEGYPALLGGVALAGALGASGIAASGRAVFHWFPRDERGLALGLRQTAVPVGAAAASFSLPPLAAGAGLDAALYALAGVMFIAASPRRSGCARARAPNRRRRPRRTPCAIRVSGGSAPRRR
jgi:MFS family permease